MALSAVPFDFFSRPQLHTSTYLSNTDSCDPTTRYHYAVDQDFVEQTLWHGEEFERSGFFERYYDTASFDLLKKGTVLIEREDEYDQKNRRWILKERCEMSTDFLVYEESPFTPAQLEEKLNLKMSDLKRFCSLRVDRYWKTNDSWYDTAMLEGNPDAKYYAVFTSNRECPGERSVASKVLSFISSDYVLRATVSQMLSEPEKQLALSVQFYVRKPKSGDAEFCL
jgi:hypothetical protein